MRSFARPAGGSQPCRRQRSCGTARRLELESRSGKVNDRVVQVRVSGCPVADRCQAYIESVWLVNLLSVPGAAEKQGRFGRTGLAMGLQARGQRQCARRELYERLRVIASVLECLRVFASVYKSVTERRRGNDEAGEGGGCGPRRPMQPPKVSLRGAPEFSETTLKKDASQIRDPGCQKGFSRHCSLGRRARQASIAWAPSQDRQMPSCCLRC